MKPKRRSDEFIRRKKEARKVAPLEAIETEYPKKTAMPRSKKDRSRRGKWRPASRKRQDTISHDNLNKFEQRFIQGCQDQGMNDSEIQKWMQEI